MLKSTDYKERISNNPNGLTWSNDETKFGQKMLEKMGWKKGKGLGANETGMTDHVKVSMKSDKKGLGCVQVHTDKWLDRLDEYEAILAQLSGSSNDISPGDQEKKPEEFESLSRKSESVRNRVHYSKFARGKDLSLKSKTDVDCIFGGKRKKRKEESEESVNKEEPPSDQNSANGKEGKQFGVVTTTSSTNLQDYFAQKMASLRRAKSNTQLCEADKPSESSLERPSSISCFDDSDCLTLKPLKTKKKKRKNPENSSEEPVNCVSSSEIATECSAVEKEKIEEKNTLDEKASVADDLTAADDVMSVTSSKKSKKRKKIKRVRDEDNLDADGSGNDDCDTVHDDLVASSRSKKRSRDAEQVIVDSDKTEDLGGSKKKKKHAKL